MRIVGVPPSGGMKPTTPTIGTATDDGTGTGVSVAFTPSTYIGKDTITYTATSSPGSLTNTGSGSPIVVSGLTTGTAYTFTVAGTTNYGVASDSSAASNSVTPASPSSYESIATVTLSGTATSITLSSIPSTYKSLQLRGILRSDRAAATGRVSITMNNDTGANYIAHWILGTGAAASGDNSGTGVSSIYNTYFPAASTTSSIFGGFVIDIIDYASTSKTKVLREFYGFDGNGSGNVSLLSGLWNSTSAVNRLDFSTSGFNMIAGSTVALYGIKG